MVGSNAQRNADFFPNRINMYVKAMKYAADVHDDGFYKLSFGAPAVSDPDGIIDGVTITGGVTISPSSFVGAVVAVSDAPWGRNVIIDASAANSPDCHIYGFDYLGQAMIETIAFNGTTAVDGVKAFMRVTKVVAETGITGTMDLGFGDVLGLPYKTIKVEAELEDGVLGSAGTLVGGVLTDPQTLVTGDPRGTYDPNGTLDETADFTILAYADDWVNAAGNGGLYGIAHAIV